MPVLGQLMSLDYPISRPFRWRGFGPLVFLGSFVALVALTVLNFATVGHEPIAVVSPLFFNASTSWWSRVSNRKDSGCQTHIFLLGDSFYSNISAFPLQVLSIAPPSTLPLASQTSTSTRWSDLAPPDSLYGFNYQGEELGDSCYSMDLTKNTSRRVISIRADASKMEVTGSVRFFCENVGALVQLEASHTTRALSYRPPSANYATRGLEGQVATFGLRDALRTLVDGFAMDLLVGMHLAGGTAHELTTLFSEGYMTCVDSSGNSLPTLDCAEPPQLVTLVSRGKLGNGTATLVADLQPPTTGYTGDALPRVMTDSMANFVAALHSATLVDLGVPSDNSILRSGDLFKQAIVSNDQVTAFYASEASSSTTSVGSSIPGESIPTLGLRSLWTLDASYADFLRAEPTVEFTARAFTPATVGLNYFCNELKLKSPLNLIVSIGVADASLFAALWTGFMFVAVMLARRGGNNVCQACATQSAYTPVSNPSRTCAPSPSPRKDALPNSPFFTGHVA